MTMGETIRALRIKHGMTQEELGKIIGVQKSAIRKYESGMVENIPRSSIKMMANVFGVTPSYLMGWTDEENTPTAHTEEISDDERDVLELYRSLAESTRPLFINLARSLANIPEQNQPMVYALIDFALNKK